MDNRLSLYLEKMECILIGTRHSLIEGQVEGWRARVMGGGLKLWVAGWNHRIMGGGLELWMVG